MNFNAFQIAFLVVLVAKTVADYALELLNKRTVQAHAATVPAPFCETVNAATYKKSVAYTLEKTNFGFVATAYETLWSLALVLFVFAPLFEFACGVAGLDNGLSGWSATWREGSILVAISIVLSFLSKPFDLYDTFKIEAKYGFNKSSLGLWIGDEIKGIVLGIIIGLPLSWALLAFYHEFPQTWWIFAQIAFFAFQLLLLIVYPILILPLFNKLSPLPDGELKARLEALARRSGFVAKKIEVIDGSKRSGHSNAYFTGFGKWRRIVLFDTLVEQLSPEEIEAVLAHEIGHSRRGHVTKRLIFAFVAGLVALWIVNFLISCPKFFEAFGFEYRENIMVVPALLLLSQIAGFVLFWVSPISNFFSRKHEYEADAFAKEALGTGAPLISALRKLHKENLGNLTPHPLYSAFHYSHPTLLERENALK
ncbi:MAG: M48 family metallopeptidase [Opitutae bacterium]|nr:M48 family metallopeptidase [Opitutae bacterium]MCD8298255.1 M48 family metallopeptidase [Opitutae bacterium]